MIARIENRFFLFMTSLGEKFIAKLIQKTIKLIPACKELFIYSMRDNKLYKNYLLLLSN